MVVTEESIVEYVIYCRKSTDESSGMQVQSIPDQINACVKYAQDHGLTIKKKPQNFSDFETEYDVLKEDQDLDNQSIYQDTKDYFIIKEQESAKTPGIRKKWRKLISLIKEGKIKGLLSYSPDRQARNLLEGGELIDLVDGGLIELKYTNFHFEKNASGKMMLGIRFVFSKQFSDKLSEDVGRGKKSAIGKGKGEGKFKHGYFMNDEVYHQPHPVYFRLIKEAFRMRIYDNRTDEEIARWLTLNGYKREYKNGTAPTNINPKAIYKMWTDPFYYGLFQSGDNQSDLNVTNPYYQPMITENEYKILVDRHYDNRKKFGKKTPHQELQSLAIVPDGFVRSFDGYSMTLTLPNRNTRFAANLKKARVNNPRAQLTDVVSLSQIWYRCAVKESQYKEQKITAQGIDDAIYYMLSHIEVDQPAYELFIQYAKNDYLEKLNNMKEEIGKLQIHQKSIRSQREKLIVDSISHNMDDDQQQAYQKKKKEYDDKLDYIQKQIASVEVSDRDAIVELEIFIKTLGGIGEFYRKATNVQKRHIVSLFFLNARISNDKPVTIYGIRGLEPLFTKLYQSGGT